MILTLPQNALRRPADVDVSDLTTAERDGDAYWLPSGELVIPFVTEPTEAEQARIRLRLLTVDDTDEAVVDQMRTLMDDLDDDLSTVARAVRLLLADKLGPLA